MKTITKKQKEVYDYICEYSNKHGYAPTQNEIKDHFELKSLGSVQRYIKYLSEAGYLATDWNAKRGLRVLSPNEESMDGDNMIPLLGDVAAGNPIEAIENPTNKVELPTHLLRTGKKYFALTVNGDSMIEDGILDGDIVVCQQQSNANQGEIVVAVIEGEATLKHFYKYSDRIELHPANSSMKPFIYTGGDLKIVGTLSSLIRSYD